jgi:hypothetical protein
MLLRHKLKFFLICEVCSEIIAAFYLDEISIPIHALMFRPVDEEHGYPPPFPEGQDWVLMQCPFGPHRPFIFDAEKELQGPSRLLTPVGYVQIPKPIKPGAEKVTVPESAPSEIVYPTGDDVGQTITIPAESLPEEFVPPNPGEEKLVAEPRKVAFMCTFPGCGRAFKSQAALNGHMKGHSRLYGDEI